MKRPFPRDDHERFSGHLRHYHRSGGQTRRTWDEWVDGKSAKTGSAKKWLNTAVIVLALLALGSIIAGLIIELR